MFLTAILIAAGVVMLVCGIWIVVLAFRESIFWGLVAIFVPLGKLVFVLTHWEEASTPFLSSLCAALVIGGVVICQPDAVSDHRTPRQTARTDEEVLATSNPADADVVPLAGQRANYARHAADLQEQYARLSSEHTAMRPGTSDVSTYNAHLKHYNEALRDLQAEKARLDAPSSR